MRRAVEQEMEASRRVLSLLVDNSRQDGELVRVDLKEEKDFSRLEEGMEGWLATWSSRDGRGNITMNGGGCVAVVAVEDAILALKLVRGNLPQNGCLLRLYQPNYLEPLKEVWGRSEAKGYSERFEQKLAAGPEGNPLRHERFTWLRRAQRDAFGLVQWKAGFLWGPPGTGKTTTLAALLAEKLMSEPKSRMLILSTTNPTVDDLLLAVDIQLEKLGCAADRLPRVSLKRVGRMFQSAKFKSRQHLLPKGDVKLLDELELLEAEPPPQGEVQKYHAWKERRDLLKRKLESDLRSVLQSSRLVAITTSRALFGFQCLRDTVDLDLVVFEEASQIPLPVAVALSDLGRCVLFGGDPKQLAPICKSGEATAKQLFSQSAFEVRDDRQGNSVFLDEQSRMAHPICRMISKVFYDGKLRVADDAKLNPIWLRERRPLPMPRQMGAANSYWVEVSGLTRWSPYFGGNVREDTGNEALDIVAELSAKVDPRQIVMLTPYRGQRQWFVKELKKRRISGINVSTVHRAQGTECDTIVFDPVNLQNEFLGDLDRARRLLNVALSRAKARVIVVGVQGDLEHPILRDLHHWIEIKAGGAARSAPPATPHISCVIDDEAALLASRGKVFLFPVDSLNPSVEVVLVDYVPPNLRFRLKDGGASEKVKRETVINRISRQRDIYRESGVRSAGLKEPPKGAIAKPLHEYLESEDFPYNLDDEVVSFQDRGIRGFLECWVLKVEPNRVRMHIINRNGQEEWFQVSQLRGHASKVVAVHSSKATEEKEPKPIPWPKSTGRLALSAALGKREFPAGMVGKTLICGPEQDTWLLVVQVEGGRLLVGDEDTKQEYWTNRADLKQIL